MPVQTDKNIRIPVPGEEGKHSGHKIRTIVVSTSKGIKGLYCITCKKIITYIFAKNKGWTMASARKWIREHTEKVKSLSEINVDQEEEFLKIIAVMDDGSTEEYIPNSYSFEMTEDIEDFTTGMDKLYEEGEEIGDEFEIAIDGEGDVTSMVFKAEKQGKYHRARVIDPKKFQSNTFRIIDIDKEKGIRAAIGRLKGKTTTTVQAYLFDASKWTPEKAKKWLRDHDINWIEFVEGEAKKMDDDKARGQGQGVGGQRQGDGGTDTCICPKCGREEPHERGVPCNRNKCPACGTPMVGKSEKVESQFEEMELIKVDKVKQLVYGVFLVPEKADHDGDVISVEDVEKVAHGFVADYRTIDEMHRNIIQAEIVESAIAWDDELEFHGKTLKKGTWFGAVKIHDKQVWDKVVSGKYKGFSVRIAGVRERIVE